MFARKKPRSATTSRTPEADRETVLHEQWGEGFAARLMVAIRSAVKGEISGHLTAGRSVPVIKHGEKTIIGPSRLER
jgi:hypothetical protein